MTRFLAALAVAAVSGWHPVAHDTEKGSFLVAGTAATVQHPHAVLLRVRSTPRAAVGGVWEASCDGKVTKGHMHGRTPLVRHPRLGVAHPSSCRVVAHVTFAHAGTVTLTILSR